MAELDRGGEGVERALPRELRKEDCDIATVLDEAMSASVKPPIEQGPPGGPYDYDTHELRIDAALDATACKRLGRLGGLDVDKVRSLMVVRRLVNRALAAGQVEAARGWSVRLMALGLDLTGAAPATHGVIGAELASAGAQSLIDVVRHPGLDVEDAAEALVLAGTLDAGAPSGAWVIDRVATDRMRRGLGGPEVNKLSAEELEQVAGLAAEWWAAVSAAAEEPGAPVPAPPSVEGEHMSAVLGLLTGDGAEALVEALRKGKSHRIAAVALTASKVRAEEGQACGPPWRGDPPVDPQSGKAATWDPATCTLTVGGDSWSLPPAGA